MFCSQHFLNIRSSFRTSEARKSSASLNCTCNRNTQIWSIDSLVYLVARQTDDCKCSDERYQHRQSQKYWNITRKYWWTGAVISPKYLFITPAVKPAPNKGRDGSREYNTIQVAIPKNIFSNVNVSWFRRLVGNIDTGTMGIVDEYTRLFGKSSFIQVLGQQAGWLNWNI